MMGMTRSGELIIMEIGINKCKRCGICCKFEIDGKLIECIYLQKIGNKYWCRIYSNRIGVKIHPKYDRYCGYRIRKKKLYPDCPYNEDVIAKYGIENVKME